MRVQVNRDRKLRKASEVLGKVDKIRRYLEGIIEDVRALSGKRGALVFSRDNMVFNRPVIGRLADYNFFLKIADLGDGGEVVLFQGRHAGVTLKQRQRRSSNFVRHYLIVAY